MLSRLSSQFFHDYTILGLTSSNGNLEIVRQKSTFTKTAYVLLLLWNISEQTNITQSCSDHERWCFDSRYSEYHNHNSLKSSANVKSQKPPEYYNFLASFSCCPSCPTFTLPRFGGKSLNYDSFILNF